MAQLTVEERLSRLEGVYEHLATKTDIANLKTNITSLESGLRTDMANSEARLRADMASLEARLSADMASLDARLSAGTASLDTEVKTEAANFRTELREMEVRLTRWMIGSMAVWAAVIIGAIRILGG